MRSDQSESLEPWPPGPGLPAHDAMPCTPQAAASPAPDWRCTARAAAAPAAPACAAAPAAAGASVLDALLSTLGGDEGGPSARSGLSMQPLNAPPAAALPPAQRSPPGAPRRHTRPLPPPPEVPPTIIAALHAAPTSAAASPFASCVAAEHWADTASSNWGAAGGKGDVHPALLQAFAWLDACQPGKAAELA